MLFPTIIKDLNSNRSSTSRTQSIGNWILKPRVEVASSWPDHLYVSINLSVARFDICFHIGSHQHIEAREFASHKLELDVTESLFIEEKEEVKTRFDLFKRLGVPIVLDDCGSGYSNLGYL